METTDRDLDILNVLKDFPENNEDAALYIRGKVNSNGVWFVNKGEGLSISHVLYNYMCGVEGAELTVLDAALFYLNQDRELRKEFKKRLKKW